jgi:hypothetical protein
MMAIMGTTTDTPEKVAKWYSDQFKKLGWTLEVGTTDGVTATKGNAYGGVTTLASETDGTVINASILPKDSIDLGTQNLDQGLQESRQLLYDTKKANPDSLEDVTYINEEGLDTSGDTGWEDVPLE